MGIASLSLMPEYIMLTCSHCTKPFRRRQCEMPHLNRRGIFTYYCSRSCYGEAQRKQLPDCIASEYEGGTSTVELGLKYGVTGTTVVKRLRSLGVSIRDKAEHLALHNPTKGKGHTEATKQKLREANLRQFSRVGARERHASITRRLISEGKVPKTSSVEDKVANFLEEIGLPFQRSKPIRGERGTFVACVDFLLPDNVVLEVQGDYWHANPQVYPSGPIHASQRKSVQNDIRKHEELTSLGYLVVYVWEAEVNRLGRRALEEVLWCWSCSSTK